MAQVEKWIRYSDLTIIQKINVKANAVTANKVFGVDTNGWTPMLRAQSDFMHYHYQYSTPFHYTNR